MSEPLHAAPVPDDAIQGVVDNERGAVGNRQSSRRPPMRARPQSWHPYGPVEPPLEGSSRSIGVHSILNPPAQPSIESVANGSLDSRSAPRASSPRPRKGSSPLARPMHSIAQHPLSPRSTARPMMNPGSPSARFVGGGRSGQSSVSQSPLVAHEPLGIRQTPASSPLPMDATLRPLASLPVTSGPGVASLHSTPSVHSRHTSIGPPQLTTPHTQETSPTTTHSSFSQFSRASPAVTNVSIQPATAPYSASSTPYMPMETIPRGASAVPQRSMEESQAGITAQPPSTAPGTPGSTSSLPGLIPCVLDLKSGSTSQAEKRKANSDASRRFRNRKRNELQLEQRLAAQEDKIRHQNEEILALVQQRDHYRSERDFFRDNLARSTSSQLPPRPSSPRVSAAASLMPTPSAETTPGNWPPGDIVRAAPGPQSTPAGAARPQGNWTGTPAPYAAVPHGSAPPSIGRDAAPSGPPVSGGPLPPFQGSWPRQ